MFGKSKQKLDNRKTKEERFKRIASRRVQEILNKMRLLRNCANRGNYSYTEEQVRKIFNAIDDEWKKVKSDFNKGKNKNREFMLD
tara:strand:- start:1533 stop:1787 length:255 start_codon:yes stop_codon:yes gene_type:complete